MDNPRDHRADDDAPLAPDGAQLLAAMRRSEQDLAAGQTVPLADVMTELDEIAAEVELRRRIRRA